MEDKAPDKVPEGKAVPGVPGTPAPSPGQGKAEPVGKEKAAVSGKVIEIPTPKAEAKTAVQPSLGKEAPAKGNKSAPGKNDPTRATRPPLVRMASARVTRPLPARSARKRTATAMRSSLAIGARWRVKWLVWRKCPFSSGK